MLKHIRVLSERHSPGFTFLFITFTLTQPSCPLLCQCLCFTDNPSLFSISNPPLLPLPLSPSLFSALLSHFTKPLMPISLLLIQRIAVFACIHKCWPPTNHHILHSTLSVLPDSQLIPFVPENINYQNRLFCAQNTQNHHLALAALSQSWCQQCQPLVNPLLAHLVPQTPSLNAWSPSTSAQNQRSVQDPKTNRDPPSYPDRAHLSPPMLPVR